MVTFEDLTGIKLPVRQVSEDLDNIQFGRNSLGINITKGPFFAARILLLADQIEAFVLSIKNPDADTLKLLLIKGDYLSKLTSLEWFQVATVQNVVTKILDTKPAVAEFLNETLPKIISNGKKYGPKNKYKNCYIVNECQKMFVEHLRDAIILKKPVKIL